MVRIGNAVVGALNVLTFLLGLAAVGGSIYVSIRGADASECQKALRNPLLIGGVFVVLMSTLGIVGSFGRVNVVMYIFLFVTFLLILGFIIWTIFALFVTNSEVSRRMWKGYKVADFEHWLQRYVINDYERWNEVKSCLIDAHVCRNSDSLFFKDLSYIQSGCCKPPAYCGFTRENVAFWVEPETGPAVEDGDCKIWSNSQNKLCYDCNSCKGGVLTDTSQHWRQRLTIFNTIVIVYFALVYILGCYAIWSTRSRFRQNKHPTQTPLYP